MDSHVSIGSSLLAEKLFLEKIKINTIVKPLAFLESKALCVLTDLP